MKKLACIIGGIIITAVLFFVPMAVVLTFVYVDDGFLKFLSVIIGAIELVLGGVFIITEILYND